MAEKESEWIFPENLKKQEERERKEVENGIFNGGEDFGSYYNHNRLSCAKVSIGIRLQNRFPHKFI